MPATIDYLFQDNNGKQARVRIYVSDTLPLLSVDNAVSTVGAALASISDAALISAKFTWKIQFSNIIPASIQSNVYERLFVFFRNTTHSASLSIPSPGELPFTLVGPYRDITISRDDLVLLGVQDLGALLAESAILPDGSSWPETVQVAVRSKNQL